MILLLPPVTFANSFPPALLEAGVSHDGDSNIYWLHPAR